MHTTRDAVDRERFRDRLNRRTAIRVAAGANSLAVGILVTSPPDARQISGRAAESTRKTICFTAALVSSSFVGTRSTFGGSPMTGLPRKAST
jgi:hypothetical protein